MKKFKTKIGFVLAGLYLLVTIIIAIYVLTCNGIFCGLVLVLPTMPWVFLLEGFIDIGDSLFGFLFIVVLNTTLLYYFGYLLSKIFKKLKK